MSSQTCRTCTHRPALPTPAAEGAAGEQRQTEPLLRRSGPSSWNTANTRPVGFLWRGR